LLFYFQNYLLYPKTHRFVIWITSELSTVSLSWQRLQLVLCHINNFYGKVSSVDGQLLV